MSSRSILWVKRAFKMHISAIGGALILGAFFLGDMNGRRHSDIVALVKECVKQGGDWRYDNYIAPVKGKQFICKNTKQ